MKGRQKTAGLSQMSFLVILVFLLILIGIFFVFTPINEKITKIFESIDFGRQTAAVVLTNGSSSRIWIEGNEGSRSGTMTLESSSQSITGQFVYPNSTNDNLSCSTNNNKITYTISVPTSGNYYAWGRFYYPSTVSNAANSFCLQIDNGSVSRFGNNQDFLGQVHWDGDGVVESGSPTKLNLGSLSAGSHTVTIYQREASVGIPPRLDAILLTNESSYVPSDNDARDAFSGTTPPPTPPPSDPDPTPDPTPPPDITPGTVSTQTSVSKDGITFYFAKPYKVGKYANGDYWVLAEAQSVGAQKLVELDRVEPPATDTKHGMMANPNTIHYQGFGSDINAFDSNLRASESGTYPGGTSLVKAITERITPTHTWKHLKVATVLTVVNEIPEGNGAYSFRPPYVGTNKKTYRVSQLQTQLLPRLQRVSSSKSLEQVRVGFSKLRLDHGNGSQGRQMHPWEAMENYGAPLGNENADAVLALYFNDPISEKMPALINVVQYGIDLYHSALLDKNDDLWRDGGGHRPGQKLPMSFAAVMLNDNVIKQYILDEAKLQDEVDKNGYRGKDSVFHEDYMVYYGVHGQALFGRMDRNWSPGTYWVRRNNNVERDPYALIDAGSAEEIPDDYQACCTSFTWKGSVIAVRLMPELKALWTRQSIFDYVDRWVKCGAWTKPDVVSERVLQWGTDMRGIDNPPRNQSSHNTWGDLNGTHQSSFINSMWSAYRGSNPATCNLTSVPTPSPTSDTTAPSTPTNLFATTISSSQINLNWSASTDNVAVTGYRVYRNNSLINTVTTTSFADSGLSSNTAYTYRISAIDAAGNVSSQSSQVSATTQSGVVADTAAPSTPTSLSATVISSSQINLNWNASTDNVAVTGYRIYRNGTFFGETDTTTVTNIGLNPDTTYTYQVSAIDRALNESSKSSIVSAKTQASVTPSTHNIWIPGKNKKTSNGKMKVDSTYTNIDSSASASLNLSQLANLSVLAQSTSGNSIGNFSEKSLSDEMLYAEGNIDNLSCSAVADRVTYNVDVPTSDVWYVWGRFYYPSPLPNPANSFCIRIDNGPIYPFGNNQDFKQVFHWDGDGRVESGSVSNLSLGLISAGSHIVTIYPREVAVGPSPRLDAFMLTNDRTYKPVDTDAVTVLGVASNGSSPSGGTSGGGGSTQTTTTTISSTGDPQVTVNTTLPDGNTRTDTARSSGGGGGGGVSNKTPTVLNPGARINLLNFTNPLISSVAFGSSFSRNLTVGSRGNDVLALQRLLNASGFQISTTGGGSPGNETDYFGSLTRSALARFQAANSISPPSGFFGPLTRAFVAKVSGTSSTPPTTTITQPSVSTNGFSRNLTVGSRGNDVLALQRLLNASGFQISTTGGGSPGNETDYFGSLTRSALARFQAANSISPPSGFFGPLTRAFVQKLLTQ